MNYFEIFFRLNKSLHLVLFVKKSKVGMAYWVPLDSIPYQLKSLVSGLSLCPSPVITFSPINPGLKDWIQNHVIQDQVSG